MQYDDYIITIDENGRPYIAHAIDGANRRFVKYINKIRMKNGKIRYFYNMDEIRAFFRKKQNGINYGRRPTAHKRNMSGSAKQGWSTRRLYDH